MDRIWAPWRAKYIQGKKRRACLFCQVAKGRQDRKNYVVYRGKFSFSLLNIFPYTNGHIMVSPYRHVKDIDGLKNEELLDMLKVLKATKRKLNKILKPNGYNIGVNIGKVSGAGFDKHLHVHIVPRWKGDVNFMSVLFDTKVISQSLTSLYNKLMKSEAE